MKDYSKIIETERLILRKFEISDYKDMFKNYLSHDEVSKYLTWNTYKSLNEAQNYLSNIVLPDYENENTYRWAIVLKETSEVVGCIDVVDKDLKKKRAELGYVLGNEFWGQGIMPEAGKAVIDYLFEEGFVRVQALHNVENPKSGRVMQKIGMLHEGTLKKFALDNNDKLVDCELYAIINDKKN